MTTKRILKSVELVLIGLVYCTLFLCCFNLLFIKNPIKADVDVLEIYTKDDLIEFATNSNSGVDYTNTTIKLMADIDLSNVNWVPIGASTKNRFYGVFDGNGHTISNLQLSTGISGLFGVSSGTIKNLIVKSNIVLQEINETSRIGGIVGIMQKSTYNDIEYIGSLNNCAVYLDINISSSTTNTVYLGGIVGQMTYCNITDCAVYVTNNFNFTDTMYFGLISPNNSNCNASNCVAYGDLNKENLKSSNISAEYNLKTQTFTADAWAFCNSCNQYYLKIDNSHNHKIIITPTLTKTEYEYTPNELQLEFQKIEKQNNSDDVVLNYSLSELVLGENTANIYLSGLDANKYELTQNTVTFNIKQKEVLINIANNTSVYGDDLNQIKYTTDCLDELSLEFDLVKDNIACDGKVGIYNIIAGCKNNFYKINSNDAFYTITQRTISLENDNFKTTFNNENQLPVLKLNNILEKDKSAVYYRFNDTNCKNKGVYTLNFELVGENIENYILNKNIVTLEIVQKSIQADWEEKVFYFNNTVQYPKATINTQISGLELIYYYENMGKNAGKNSVCVKTENPNFEITNNTKEYKILTYEAQVDWGKNTFTFDNQNHFPEYKINLPFEYNFDVEPNEFNKNAGEHTASLVYNDTNIVLKNPTRTYNIEKYNLTLSWQNLEFKFDNKPHRPDLSYSLPFAYDLIMTISDGKINAGTYVCNVESDDKNIILENFSTNYQILPKNVELTWTNTELIYNGTKQKPECYFESFNYVFDIKITGEAENIGEYIATATTEDKNIILSNNTVDFLIAELICEVLWSELSFEYTGDIVCPKAEINLKNIKSNILKYKIVGGASEIGKHVATAISENPNIILTNASCVYEIKENKLVCQNDNNYKIEVVGALGNVDLTIDNAPSNLQKVLPQGYDIIYAFKLSLVQNDQTESNTSLRSELLFANVDKYSINITLKQNLTNNFELFQISNEVKNIPYTLENNTLNFNTNELGIICLAYNNNDLTYINILIGSCIGGIALLTISVVWLGIYVKKGRKVYFKKIN